MSRLVLIAGLLLVLGCLLTLRTPLAGLHPAATVPVRDGELWEINAN